MLTCQSDESRVNEPETTRECWAAQPITCPNAGIPANTILLFVADISDAYHKPACSEIPCWILTAKNVARRNGNGLSVSAKPLPKGFPYEWQHHAHDERHEGQRIP